MPLAIQRNRKSDNLLLAENEPQKSRAVGWARRSEKPEGRGKQIHNLKSDRAPAPPTNSTANPTNHICRTVRFNGSTDLLGQSNMNWNKANAEASHDSTRQHRAGRTALASDGQTEDGVRT